MFLRRFTDFILQSRIQAMAVAFLFAFIPIIGGISILIAALVTLRKGAKAGAYVFVAATLPYLIGYVTSARLPEHTETAVMMLSVVIASNLLTWGFAVVLRQYDNWNVILEAAALLGIILVMAVHLIHPDIQGWWGAQLNNYFSKTAETMSQLNQGDVEAQAMAEQIQLKAINAVKRFATGIMAVSILFNAILQLLIARWWQATLVNPGGLRKELYQIRLGHIAGCIFVVGLVLAYMGSSIAVDMLPVMCGVFFAAGLSLIHSVMSLTRFGWLWLVLIYVGVIWTFPVGAVVIAIIALLDTGLNFRKRFQF